MEKPPDKGGRCAEEVAQNNGTTFVLKKKGQEEISWTWKRKPLQGYGHEIALSYRRKVLTNIESVLTDVGGEKLVQQFVDGCFGHLLRFIGGISCNKALHELISREIDLAGARDDELWFRIGKTNIRFAPAEYALVTGLRFGSSSFDPLGTHEMPPEGVLNQICSGQPISIKELWNMFNQQRLRGSPEDYLKAAHVLALNLMALGHDPLKTIERWVWVLVDDLDSWNKFPWGAYTYQALMHYVSLLPRKRERVRLGYHFYGPVWALQIWAYEAIPCLGDRCALASGQVTVPRCLKWSFPKGKKILPKQFLEGKLACCVTLEPTDEEKRQPYWLSVQTEQPLGVRYASGQSQKQGRQGPARRRGVATAASLSPPRPRRSSIRTSLAESSLGERSSPVEALDTDDSVRSDPKPSARPSRRRNRTQASICSSLASGGRPRPVCRLPEILDEAQFDQLSSRLVDRLVEPMVEKLMPHVNQKIEDLFQAREVDNQLATENPGYNADCAKAEEKKEQSFDGGSSSMHNSRKTVDEPSPGLLKRLAPEDAFGSEEQREVLVNDPRLDTGVANREDSAIPNKESRSKRGGPIRAQSDSTERAGITPPGAGEADEPELLADPSSSKTTKKNSSRTSKRRSRSPSTNKEMSADQGSESSSGDERLADHPSSSKKKKKKRKLLEMETIKDLGWALFLFYNLIRALTQC